MTRIGSNNPTTDPAWMDQKINNNQELTADENKIAERQTEILTETLNTLNQPVQKGDIKAAKARVDHLENTFKNLSTEDKQYMYNLLTSNAGLAEKLEYKLSAFSREKLLKTLNPDHTTSQKVKEKISQEAKSSKTSELNTSGTARQLELQKSIPSVPLGGRDFQNKISKDSGIPSVPLGGKDFQQKISQDSGIPSVPLGGKDFQDKISKESGFPNSVPLGGEDFQKKLPTETKFPSIPLGGADFQKKVDQDPGIPSVPLGGTKIKE